MDKNLSLPELSIVVTVVEGGATLERCLNALSQQKTTYVLEVLVPYDHISQDVSSFIDKFPKFKFIDLGRILSGKIPKNAFEKHSFFDRRRTSALKIAKAELVAILEDRGVPENDWAETMVSLHRKFPHAVIGGAIENGVNKVMNWAVFICDFGRYQPPFSEVDPEYISDTNISYKKKALQDVIALWEETYDEARVNWALRRNGEGLMLSELPRTRQIRAPMSLANMLKERLHWGRNFGQSRSNELTWQKRALLLFACPILPFLLYIRHLRRQLSKGRNVKEFLIASPALFLLLVCWSVGEGTGYFEGSRFR